jgi:hypothetical protein
LRYWEIGNECYGSWETDSNNNPHDPFTYAVRARDYIQQMKALDPTLKVGVVAVPGEDNYANEYASHPAFNPRTGQTHYGWTPVVLTTLKSLGVLPDFLIHHRYPESTDQKNPAGTDSDAVLLQSSTQWALDAADLRQQINDYFGAGGASIELVCTENNSDSGAQGKQSTSLVNGLYYADSLGQLMQTEFNAFVWWDLRNGTDTNGWFDSTLYGWRDYGDLGMVNGPETLHPTFYAAKLMHEFAQPGDSIVKASSDYDLLSVYAARTSTGGLNVLVLNKDPASEFNGEVSIAGFVPDAAAMVSSYGIAQDEAARTNAPLAAQDIATNRMAVAAAVFTNSFPPLSITLLGLSPAAPQLMIEPAELGTGVKLLVEGPPQALASVQESTDLVKWTTIWTNILASGWTVVTNLTPAANTATFWRAVWQP